MADCGVDLGEARPREGGSGERTDGGGGFVVAGRSKNAVRTASGVDMIGPVRTRI
jgi:hypothetical protein